MTWWEEAVIADVLLNAALVCWLIQVTRRHNRRERAVARLKEF